MRKGYIILATAMIASGCMTLESNRGQIMEKNKEAFEEMFGSQIDPEQDWSVVEQGAVTVTVPQESEIKIYAFNGTNTSLVADYQGVTGTQKLSFDALKGVDKVYVANMTQRRAYDVDINGEISFSNPSTKAAVNYNDGNLTVETISDWTYTSLKTTLDAIAANPVTPQDYENVRYYAHHDFTMTPLFWHEVNGEVNIGVYYYKDGERIEQIVYNRLDNASEPGGFYQYFTWGNWQENTNDIFPDWLPKDQMNAADNIRSKTIHVSMSDGTEFGFFIETKHIGSAPLRVFSDFEENQIELEKVRNGEGMYAPTDSWWRSKAEEVLKYSSCVVSEYQGQSYLRFECFNRDPKDYNSLVFSINDAHIVSVYDTATPWTIAVEDMGDLNDYDFNDVVFSVAHVAGETTATIKLLAAGCTIENYIWYGDTNYGEVHALLGEGDTGKIVNTRTKSTSPKEFQIEVPANFTLTSTDFGGIKVSNSLGTVNREQFTGGVPYMICVPGNWSWPVERTSIKLAYPDFSTWVGDHTQASEWFKNMVDDESVIVK